jgi:hypothetical protein
MSVHPVDPNPNMPTLGRHVSDVSDFTTDGDKGGVKHIDEKAIPDTILEEDEGGNVGLAAYEQSKQMGEIVS